LSFTSFEHGVAAKPFADPLWFPRVKALGRLIAKGLEDRIIFRGRCRTVVQTDPPEILFPSLYDLRKCFLYNRIREYRLSPAEVKDLKRK